LFEKYVGRRQADFCEELYLSLEDVRSLIAEGMYVGSHTYNHYWLSSLGIDFQEQEIDRSLAFLEHVGAPVDRWIMCYPYGDYNADTLWLLQRRNCVAGLTTKTGRAVLAKPFELRRFDTNDFPQ
jgi:peptidoglycan/xylan/chitin deacetylase (PgdA/CDA1 family)